MTDTTPDGDAASESLLAAIQFCEATERDELAHELGQLYQRLGREIYNDPEAGHQ